MNDQNEAVALRHYGFLAFLALLNVMNSLIGSCSPAANFIVPTQV